MAKLTLEGLAKWLDKRFDQKLARFEIRFDKKLDRLEKRIDHKIDSKIDSKIDAFAITVGKSFRSVENRLDIIENDLKEFRRENAAEHAEMRTDIDLWRKDSITLGNRVGAIERKIGMETA